jgi:hypothetical protein
MVLEVFPAPHGKATSLATEAMSVHVHEVNRDGGRVIRVCSDGDSTYPQKTGERCRLLADPGAHDVRIALHRQDAIRQQILIPSTDAGYSIDIDHPGESMRHLSVDGKWLTILPARFP